MLTIKPIPAFNDNYLWLIHQTESPFAYIIDPGDDDVVQKSLEEKGLTLAGILITHKHYDHVDGIEHLVNHYQTADHAIPVYGPESSTIPQVTHICKDNDSIPLYNNAFSLSVLETPGHTPEHISYYSADAFAQPTLFCGDTLFAAGCGRLSGGTAQQLYTSLSLIQTLPDNTEIYCAHEYTLANLRFAKVVEPNNADIDQRIAHENKQRQQNIPTIPSLLSIEKATNPFLRTEQDSVRSAVSQHWGRNYQSESEVFAELRLWKDNF